MAYIIAQSDYCRRPIHWNRKTVLDVSHNDKLFSLWTAAAGAENGVEVSPASIQLDREQASHPARVSAGFFIRYTAKSYINTPAFPILAGYVEISGG